MQTRGKLLFCISALCLITGCDSSGLSKTKAGDTIKKWFITSGKATATSALPLPIGQRSGVDCSTYAMGFTHNKLENLHKAGFIKYNILEIDKKKHTLWCNITLTEKGKKYVDDRNRIIYGSRNFMTVTDVKYNEAKTTATVVYRWMFTGTPLLNFYPLENFETQRKHPLPKSGRIFSSHASFQLYEDGWRLEEGMLRKPVIFPSPKFPRPKRIR